MMEEFNPYTVLGCRELDAYVHHRVLKNPLSHDYPNYSTDQAVAENLRRTLQRENGIKIISGKTTVSDKTWFARYEREAGNPTEVLAETFALAICRLVILLIRRG